MTVELQVTTHYSFLRGASSPEELFATAALLGLTALGVTDRHSVAGLVKAHEAARATGCRLVAGCRLDLSGPDAGTALLVYPTDRAAYGRLCRLLTLGKGRAGKGGCTLDLSDLAAWREGLIAVLLADRPDEALPRRLGRLREVFGRRAHCALTRRFGVNDQLRLDRVADLARAARIPTVATGDVLCHVPERRLLQDVVTCIRLGTTIDAAGFARERHAGRHLQAPAETARLFARHPEAVERARAIAEACRFSLDDLTYTYPDEVGEDGRSALERLETMTLEGAARRYPDGVPEEVHRQIRHEFELIARKGYAPYFLTVEAIVRFAQRQGILCQGRGSAANSVVCYCLGITAIDPVRQKLLFERFVSDNRDEPPDIDVDFEHERREEVIQWVYATYGRHRAALTATVIRYGARGAVREVGKVLGVPEDVTGALARLVWGWSREGVGEREARALNLNLADRRLRLTLDLARALIGTPRHLGQHPGGFVLTLDRLDELCPITPATMENRQTIEWDKDDIEALRFMKVDVLGLGMLGCLRRAFELLGEHRGETDPPREIAAIPPEDEATYAMIRRADTLGVFQIESRAQMAMLPRMQPRNLYDLTIEVAVVRPGPIQGDMVHPYLRRRRGIERPEYPSEALRSVLERTLGVPLFQEQAMQVAIVAAGFTPAEADGLRRAMATFKANGKIGLYREKLIAGMIRNGYAADFAERTFRQLEGFGSYGFPESHAASFALIAYASSWLKCHHPDVFCCALLNAQPMGFYAPAQIVRDARRHGVPVRPIDVNASRWDCTLEKAEGPRLAVRLGLRLVRGLANAEGARIATVREADLFRSPEDLWRRTAVPLRALESLAAADAFGSLGLGRREALWAIRGLAPVPLPLFAAADAREAAIRPELDEPAVALAPMPEGAGVVADYRAASLSLGRHPVAFLRPDLARDGMSACAALRRLRDGARVTVAGLVLVRQKPGSAKGVMFITLEDETDVANLVVWPSLFARQRGLILSAGMMAARGRVQREGEVIHLVAEHLIDLSDLLAQVGGRGAPLPPPGGRGDEARHGGGDARGLARPAGALRIRTRDFR
ncbi:DNA polymerase III, alpha subunit [Methylobacterium sp. 4-46]|uniref:error-prone DNA polymerase n=1 Tax=unclassified Methylobacterium TaxID=2615210 RepID=UPI000165CD4C|nr:MULTISPECIES: error-prone DNA polymerase [Methylobacterium]ACA18837.1 DNA polymerase III, alpha subunit [Methylobacterium sp. 4-46]WFT78063.1 error-prone DNA polymerase [Methylobacterium nodulans]